MSMQSVRREYLLVWKAGQKTSDTIFAMTSAGKMRSEFSLVMK